MSKEDMANMPKEVREFYELQEKYSTDEEKCKLFNHGFLNSIAIGYAMIAMRDAGVPDDKIKEVEHVMYSNFDFVGAEDALKFYRTH